MFGAFHLLATSSTKSYKGTNDVPQLRIRLQPYLGALVHA